MKHWEAKTPVAEFHSNHYLRHNARRLEHLATLGLPLAGKSVLEVGAGIGDHTHFYLDRGCRVTVTEARDENLALLRQRYGTDRVRRLDMETPDLAEGPFDICHCYGLLYHLAKPDTAIAFMAGKTAQMLLLETCVSFGDHAAINPVDEQLLSPSQAVSGHGCRPTRPWVFGELAKHFEHVYATVTQPHHEEFPVDWAASGAHEGLSRSVFIASRSPLDDNPLLLRSLPDKQRRDFVTD